MANEELYGIKKTNVKTVLTKNIFTTYAPVSAAIYLEDHSLNIPYIFIKDNSLQIEERPFSNLLGVDKNNLKEIRWKSECRNPTYDKSKNAPGIDMGAELDNSFVLEFEVKLTVVPTHAERKVTEMIVRQNTQFNFAERLCYRYGDFFSNNPTVDELNRLIEERSGDQLPFMLHALWKTKGHSSEIDRKNTFDVTMISDLAYLKILLSSSLEKTNKKSEVKTRIGRILNLILGWIKEFKTKGSLTYKEVGEGSKDHLKITLYPVDYHKGLKKIYNNLRINFEQLQTIVPAKSIKELSPERRLDASIIFTLANQGLEE